MFIYIVIKDVGSKVLDKYKLGLPYIKYLLSEGYSVFLFDFSGSGISTGDYVTLGFH